MKYQYNHLICKSNYTLLVVSSHYHTCTLRRLKETSLVLKLAYVTVHTYLILHFSLTVNVSPLMMYAWIKVLT